MEGGKLEIGGSADQTDAAGDLAQKHFATIDPLGLNALSRVVMAREAGEALPKWLEPGVFARQPRGPMWGKITSFSSYSILLADA